MDDVAFATALRTSADGSGNGVFLDAALAAETLRVPPAPQPAPRLSGQLGPLLAGLPPGGSVEYVDSYLTLNEYLVPALEARGLHAPDGFWRRHLLAQHGRDDMLEELGRLSAALTAGHAGPLRQMLRAWAVPDVLAAIDAAPDLGRPREVITRQGLLLAAREVLRQNAPGLAAPDLPAAAAAFLLAQGVLDGFEKLAASAGAELYPTMDAALAHETFMNFLFNASDNPPAQLERACRLWTDSAPRESSNLRATPDEMLVQATGVDVRTIAEFGVAVWATLHTLPMFQPPYLPMWNHLPFPAETISRLTAMVADSPDSLWERMSTGTEGPWDFLAFEQTPVLLMDGRPPLVLDQVLFWRRLSTGLFYDVLDNEQLLGEKQSRAWTSGYGALVEQMSAHVLRQLSLPLIGGGQAFWDGDALKDAFGGPGQRTADGALLYGSTAVVAEIVSSGMKLESRVQGHQTALQEDLEKQLWTKVEQLDGTIAALRNDPSRLPGWPPDTVDAFIPLLIEGREFARMPVTHAYVISETPARGLFAGGDTLPLAIVDLSEIEMLLAVKESTGQLVPDLLRAWITGPRQGWPLGNHLMDTYGDLAAKLQPAMSMDGIMKIFKDLKDRAATHAGITPDESPD